ncbi:DUF5107 domain-containing protein [Alkalitalea saponilacus]|uniref:Tfp pilus assembly protein PilF n=1 Tax=Alkalitalea saponilacus TaxID=889453 RepID=A0A1T5C849_9BACT|nr:DUF5107 domain-containing protein [Alkalitalea saponilacus]ASB49765.1 DUF5107 domain-containing protein [Alkalitalea saponilacus]SKB55533.1 Tfp pilus assembly protein PilF [Alkalitalea saponilacus]
MSTNKAKAWKESVVIPTYETGLPEKNPMFLEKRVYQGSSGVVYPYPVIEKIFDEKKDKVWQALFLENDFVKIMILPELGGRIQMAYDKTKERHFVYYNQVIKPALVGLTGPWISGGIEFNWPQHHRPTTFDPVDFSIEENQDGSVTVWCSELERMFRTKGMAGFTLYPDKSYLQIRVQIYNPTPLPQTFLWWANPAVKVNDHYQSVFPPDVNAVFDHGKRDVSSFPVATGTYYKIDYSPGTDISRYKNIPVPTSYMAIVSKYDFVGGYENDSKGGLLHVANHHVSPGKKQWTWGNGEFGKAWDRHLTDEDGPYIELMCGVFTDNQPDFTWLAPHEEKSFVQYFMPYRDLGVVKNATKDAMLNMEIVNDRLVLKVYTTGVYPNATIEVLAKGESIFVDTYSASPLNSYEKSIELPEDTVEEDLFLKVTQNDGTVLVSWQPEGCRQNEIPDPAKPAKLPEEIDSIEQLFLTGHHLEQYRHATYQPTDYYEEALKREPGDVRCNNAMGLWLLRKGRFSDAEEFFRRAIKTLTDRNPNPYDGEPYYNLGLALRFQGKNEDAYSAFYKSTWMAAWQNCGYFQLARLDTLKGEYSSALEHINKSISRNSNDHKALHLKCAILRHAGKINEALQLAEKALTIDRFNFGVLYEKTLVFGDNKAQQEFSQLIRKNIHNYIEYALDYAAAGLWKDAIDLLGFGLEEAGTYPMGWYYMGWFLCNTGDLEEAFSAFQNAENALPDYCFPNQLESLIALNKAIEINPGGSKAYYYLGNYWYNARQYEIAANCWEKSAQLDVTFPTVFRNLALNYFNKQKNAEYALDCMEKAFQLDPGDARVLMELDQLTRRLNHPVENRLRRLFNFPELIEQRDDLYLEVVTLLNLQGNHEQALDMLMKRKFHPWEGGEGKVTNQYVSCLVEMAKKAMMQKNFDLALDYLKRSLDYPENLGEGKLAGAQENDIWYWMGCVFDEMNQVSEAYECWEKATKGISKPAAAIFYNDQSPDKIFYQGLALLKLQRRREADDRFSRLIEYGNKHLNDEVRIDYFAVSLPDLLIWDDDLDIRNRIHCLYIKGLGLLGHGRVDEAETLFKEVSSMECTHEGVKIHQKMIESMYKLS